MCTAVSWQADDHYFGRNLDLEYHYSEAVTITPRHYPFRFRFLPLTDSHYAIIGVATIEAGYPLYYDATNEHGLSIAALNFPGNAAYHSPVDHLNNVAPFELIPLILGQCKTVFEARKILADINLTNTPFNNMLPLTPLHWMIADRTESIVAESMESGLCVFDNPVGILTNNPPFEYHLYNLRNYLNVTRDEPINRFSPQIELQPYSSGMGAIGLPGDLSSASRFVKAAFTKLNAISGSSENACISQFFHILNSVEQQEGCVKIGDKFEKTLYSSCCNTDKGIFYYTTYENRQITAIRMQESDITGADLLSFPLRTKQSIYFEN